MTQSDTAALFSARLQRPETTGSEGSWAFVVLPKDTSALLPRRGRVTVAGRLNEQPFQLLLEPDGQKSHWMRLDDELLKACGLEVGEQAEFQLWALDEEPEPEVPADVITALHACPEALATWQQTTPLARLDWVHWIVSAKQTKTRAKRIGDACEMLAEGHKRVCCFDTSGFYSKAFSAPRAVG